MTMKLVIVNAGNRTGDHVTIMLPQSSGKAATLKRGQTLEVSEQGDFEIAVATGHGHDDEWAGEPVVAVFDQPTRKE